MKKYSPFIIVAIAVVTLFLLFLVSAKNRPRQLNQRISLRQTDKIPYGTYVARQLLPALFPDAKISYDKNMPGSWELVDTVSANQAVILIAKDFDAEEWELKQLLRFIEKGNYAFIISNTLSYEANNYFRTQANATNLFVLPGEDQDSLKMQLEDPPFRKRLYQYPGRKYENFFSAIDTLRSIALGRNEQNKINFIELQAGKGKLYIHLAPLAFSNYFLLHKDNLHYYEQVMSILPVGLRKMTWNEYYLVKKSFKKSAPPSLFRVLFQFPSLKWGLLTAIGTLLIFVLLEMRRKQRQIPVIQPLKNESLDFVKTMGRLYYDQNDHLNLARKMSSYFLDHLRSQLKIATNTIDENLAATVHAKTGYSLERLKQIINFITFIETVPAISDVQLSGFHQELENFYQNT